MEIALISAPSRFGFTISRLSIDGVFNCFVCEDEIREVPKMPVEKWKVPGKTAIPSGRYQIMITHSQRFGRLLPILLGVPGFEGVRIHPGNTAADTEGCLLPGLTLTANGVANSRKAFDALFDKMQRAINAGDQININIQRPFK